MGMGQCQCLQDYEYTEKTSFHSKLQHDELGLGHEYSVSLDFIQAINIVQYLNLALAADK
jgi:hypothetical protein